MAHILASPGKRGAHFGITRQINSANHRRALANVARLARSNVVSRIASVAAAALPAAIDQTARLVADNPQQHHNIAGFAAGRIRQAQRVAYHNRRAEAGRADAVRAIVNSERGAQMMDLMLEDTERGESLAGSPQSCLEARKRLANFAHASAPPTATSPP